MDLFAADDFVTPSRQELSPGAWLLRGFASAQSAPLLADIFNVIEHAPLRHLQTPSGLTMSVAMTCCGEFGWHSDRFGYRYQRHDPQTNQRWPAMPPLFLSLAQEAALAAGYGDFVPDACLINHYVPGARLSLHQDKDELDLGQPIVSISLGLAATFLWGGQQRQDKAYKIALHSGDVVVWGGPSRMIFHGISPLQDGQHPLTGRCRFNITFRCAQ